jgi:hypothetical protein
MGRVDPARLVFVDECGTHIAMTRRRARAPRGVRARGAGPVPALAAGTVIVVDDVGAHQPERIRALVAVAGCRLVFLPAYSPDLSPVEEANSLIKAVVKAAAARTRAALDAAIAVALGAGTAVDAAGWFSHAG